MGAYPQNARNGSPGVEGYPQPPAWAEARAHLSRAAAAVVGNGEKQTDVPGHLARPLMAATGEALWRHRAALIKRLRAEPTLEGYHSSLPHLSIRNWGTFAGLMWDWLPAVTNDIKRLAGLPRGATRPAAGDNVSDMGSNTVGGSGDDVKEGSNETQAVTVREEEAGTEWPALRPAASALQPTALPPGEPGRRARGRARARARRLAASTAGAAAMGALLAAAVSVAVEESLAVDAAAAMAETAAAAVAGTLAATSTAAVAAATANAVSVSDTTRAAALAADAALDSMESTAAARSGLGLIQQGAVVCLQRNDPLDLWGPVGVWADEPCPLYATVEVQAAAVDDAAAAAAEMAAAGEEVFRGRVLSGPSTDLCQGPVLSGPGTDLLGGPALPGPSSDLFRGPVLSGPSTDLFRGPVLPGPSSDPCQGSVMSGPGTALFRGPVLSGPSTDLFRGPIWSGPSSDPCQGPIV